MSADELDRLRAEAERDDLRARLAWTEARCVLDPTCERGLHSTSDHPCGRRAERPGEACRHCAEEGVERIIPDSGMCRCWTPVEDLPFATIKGLFADMGLSVEKRQATDNQED